MEELVGQLIEQRGNHCFPLRVQSSARRFAETVLAVLFPHFADTLRCDPVEVANEVASIRSQLEKLMSELSERFPVPDASATLEFLSSLRRVHEDLILDARAIYHGDPASTSIDEVILTYPGFYAISVHRVAHELALLGYPILPRLLSEYAHERTGIDIHPKATIGKSFFIDHGTGIVVGETTVIGNGVKLYQGVTLGALAVEKRMANSRRHPTIEDHVIVYANASILGGETVIGHDSIIGGSAWITESIPPFSIVSRNSEVRRRRSEVDDNLEFLI